MTTGAAECSEIQGEFGPGIVDEHRNALRSGDGVIEPVLMGLRTCQI
jgi:hypothetical protein